MLTPDQIEALRIRAGKITDPVIGFLIADIAQRISEAGQLTSTASYEIWRAQNLGLSQRQLKKELRKRLKVSHRELRKLLTQAAEVGYNFDISRFPFVQSVPFDRNEGLQRILSAAIDQAQEDLTNLTQTMGFVTHDGVVTELTEAYRKSCDFAFEKIFSGAQDYSSAIREATRGLADKGIQTLDYTSGVHRSLEAAVRGNIMGGLGLMQKQINQQTHDELGCDGWEISAHMASAPDHEPIQGKQYSDAEYARLNDSLIRSIGTLNCGHSAMGITLGVNEPQYTPEELEKMRQENEKGIDYNGRHYTQYEATQRQRALERSIRNRKRRILLDENLGDKEQLSIDQTRYVILRDEYRCFSKAAGLRTQQERMNIPGFGPKQATAAERGVNKKFQEILEKAAKGDKIVLDEEMEDIIAHKPYSEILPLRQKLSDRAARKWYLAQDANIPFAIDRSLTVEQQARQAFELRNQNRTNARELMRDQKKRKQLDLTDPNRSFEELIDSKMKRKGLTREEAIEDILRTATKTRKTVNRQLGLE